MVTGKIRWDEFLDSMQIGIEELSRRIELSEMDNSQRRIPVKLGDNSSVAKKDEILIGVGSWKKKVGSLESKFQYQEGICLADKDGAVRMGKSINISSLTDFVLLANQDLWNEWKISAGKYVAPLDFFQRFTLIVEDVSLDSCFSLIVFLSILNNVPEADIPKEMIEYVRRWESGDIHLSGDPLYSWANIHSALAHSIFEPQRNNKGKTVEKNTSLYISKAWLECLKLDLLVLSNKANPQNISNLKFNGVVSQGVAHVQYEYDQYRQSLTHANLLQLKVPIRGSNCRYKDIDAHIEEESSSLGIKKVFLRTDRENTYYKNGFSLMAVYRPHEKGTGNDIVVSVDTQAGITLEDLWWELERLEDVKWNGARPCNKPRKNLKNYFDGRKLNGDLAPNEPWWDDRGAFTLIAAPKTISLDYGKIVEGSKLSWDEVCECIWKLYNPLKNFVVKNCEGEKCKLSDTEKLIYKIDKNQSDMNKPLFIANWVEDENEVKSITLSPTVIKSFAACLESYGNKKGEILLKNLPDTDSFDVIKLNGGFGIVTEVGALIFNDWKSTDLDVNQFIPEYENANKRSVLINNVHDKLNALLFQIEEIIESKKQKAKKSMLIIDELFTLKVLIRKELAMTIEKTNRLDIMQFRQTLESRWGLGNQIENLYTMINELENSLKGKSELQTNWMISLLTLYGFPAVFLATFFGFVFEKIPEKFKVASLGFDLSAFGVHWVGIIIYIITTIIGFGFMHWFVNRNKK